MKLLLCIGKDIKDLCKNWLKNTQNFHWVSFYNIWNLLVSFWVANRHHSAWKTEFAFSKIECLGKNREHFVLLCSHFAFEMLLHCFMEHLEFNFRLVLNSASTIKHVKFACITPGMVWISQKYFRDRMMAIVRLGVGCDALVLALVDVVAGAAVCVTRRCGNCVQVFHHALQVLHLVVQLLCAVWRLQPLGETITGSILRV